MYSRTASKIRNSTPTNSYSKPGGINVDINTRGTGTALGKSLGGAAITKAGMSYSQAFAKYGPLGLGVLLFADILLADGGLASGELPEHIKNPGEQQVTKKREYEDWSGVPEEQYRFEVRYRASSSHEWREKTFGFRDKAYAPYSNMEFYFSNNIAGYGKSGFPTLKAGGGDSGKRGDFYFKFDAHNKYGTPNGTWTKRQIGSTYFDKEGEIELIKMTPYDSEELYDPKREEKTKSESTTNHSNVPPPQRASSSNPPPSGIRPSSSNSETTNSSSSKSFEGSSSKNSSSPSPKPPVVKKANVGGNPAPSLGNTDNDERPRVEVPSSLNTPAPKPPPPKKSTTPGNPDAGKTHKFGKLKEAEDTKIISETTRIRADGIKETTIQREATAEEMREYRRTISEAEKVNEREKKKRELKESYPDFSEDLDDSDIGQDVSVVNEVKREGKSKVKPPPSSVPKPGSNDNAKSIPEPDQTKDSDPTLEPAKQTPTIDDPIKDKIDKLPTLDDIAITVAGLDIIKQIAKKAGTASPVCTAEALRPAINRNKVTTVTAQGAILGQGQVTQTAVNAANSTLNHSTWGLQAIVTNTSYGLQRIQGFAQTAWKVTRADKIMAGVSMVLTVHNAMMLSNNLLSTVSEATNITFEALGIRDETDSPIDFGTAIKGRINAVLAKVLGQANYEALTLRIAKANRIYQAGINILDTTYSLFDSARTVAELTAEHMGQIGNALREAGVVYEDAYNEMSERINPQNAAMRKLGSFRDAIEVAEDAFDSVSQISSSVVETKENIAQLKTEKEELKTEIEGFITEQKDEKDEAKEEAQVTADINDADFEPGTTES